MKDYRDVPVYRHDSAYAVCCHEPEVHHASLNANIACKDALEEAMAAEFQDNHLDCEAVLDVLKERFSTERIAYVLANTILERSYDDRISGGNKQWAKEVGVISDPDTWGGKYNVRFGSDKVHSGLLNLFAVYFRENCI